MQTPRTYEQIKLLLEIRNYLSDTAADSEFAEVNLLEKQILGKDLLFALNELKNTHEDALTEKDEKIEKLERDYEELKLEFEKLKGEYLKLEQYKPLIELFTSILEKTAKDEIKKIVEQNRKQFNELFSME